MSAGKFINLGIEVVEGELNQGIWRPPQWQDPAVIMITFPGQGSDTPQYSPLTGIGATLSTSMTNYVFDAVIAAEHDQELVVTEHPVQGGASIADHAYLRPARLILDIGMSDAMDAYFNPSTWTGAPTKSVSCYQTLLALQASRIPLQVTTKLRTYSNMLIVGALARETSKTIAGLRAQISFQQIFMATVTAVGFTLGARPQDTNSTDLGQVNPQPPTSAQDSQNVVPPTYHPWNSIGAGDASSTNQSNLSALPSK